MTYLAGVNLRMSYARCNQQLKLRMRLNAGVIGCGRGGKNGRESSLRFAQPVGSCITERTIRQTRIKKQPESYSRII